MADRQILRLADLEPTVFFVRSHDSLQQGVDLSLSNPGPTVAAEVIFRGGSGVQRLDLGCVPTGESRQRIYVPDMREPTPVEVALLANGHLCDSRSLTWQSTRHWEVYVTQASHHDLGYSDLPANVLRDQDRFLDDIVRWCEETADWPEDSRFRYVIEQGWSVLHYLEHRPPEMGERLLRLLRTGQVELTALFANETSELCGHEEQIRLLYPSFQLKRRYGVPITTAELNDVPGLAWGLVSVLAGAGIRYFAPDIPDYFGWGSNRLRTFWDEQAVLPRDLPGAFWWEGPDGQRVLLWRGTGASMWTLEQTIRDLPTLLAGLAQRGYPYDLVRLRVSGGIRDNAPPSLRFSQIAREWNSRWTYPRLIVATGHQFFARFEQAAGTCLPVLRGDLPNTDYTVGATSTAKELGVNRLTHDTLTAAEKLAACAAQVSDYEYPAETVAEAYQHSLLFDEHTWGMLNPLGPAQDANLCAKAHFAYHAAALAHDLLIKTTNRIADQVHLTEEGYHLFVFNPLAEARSDVVRVPAIVPSPCVWPMHWEQPAPGEDRPAIWNRGTVFGRQLQNLPEAVFGEPFELIDVATGHSIPYQIVAVDDPYAARPLAAHRVALGDHDRFLSHHLLRVDPLQRQELVFVAEDLPPLGLKTFRIVPCTQRPSFATSLQVGAHWLESAFFRLELDPASGAVRSLYDKRLHREWVDGEAPYGLNQLLVRNPETGEIAPAGRSTISVSERGPVLASLVVRGDGLGCPRRTQEITVYHALPYIEMANRLLRDATPCLEVCFAFPLALTQPRFRFEAPNAVVEPIRDQLPGSNTDAYAVQHWITVEDARGGVAWSSLEAPLVALSEWWSMSVSPAHSALSTPDYGRPFLTDPAQLVHGHIYSLAMVNNFRTNFAPVQVADALFRYRITSFAGDEGRRRACRAGWAASTPLATAGVYGPQRGTLPPSLSFCQVDQPNVSLLTLKAAEDGDGLILRLAENEGRDTRVLVTVPFLEIGQALETNLVEEGNRTLEHDLHSVQIPMRGHGIATVRLTSSRRWPQANALAYYFA